MTDSGKTGRRGAAENLSDSVLRAKYLDYCSARVAEVLLPMSADDMYLLAQEVSKQSGGEAEAVPSFNTIVKLATERISEELALPDFPQWVREYRKDPEAFEQQFLGLWETEMKPSNQSAH